MKVKTRKIENAFREIVSNYVAEPAIAKNFDKITEEAIDVMYNNGFDDSYGSESFKPVVPGVNFKMDFEPKTRKLQLLFKPAPGKWHRITTTTTFQV